MENTEQYMLALSGLYDEVAVFDVASGACRVLSTGSSDVLFRDADTFEGGGLERIAEDNIMPEDRQAFLRFFHPKNLGAVWQSRAPRFLRFSLGTEQGCRPVIASVMPVSEHSVLYALRGIDPPEAGERHSAYSIFLHQFLQIIDKIFDEVLEVDLNTDRARIVRSTNADNKEKHVHTISDLVQLYQSRYVHEEDRAALLALFSKESLRSFTDGSKKYDLAEVRLLQDGIYTWFELSIFCITMEGHTNILIALRNIEQRKLLTSIVDRYVYKNCDYFIYLNADKNSYIMFSGSDSGTPLPPVIAHDYTDELIKYAHAFVVPEDVEMTIQEMKIPRVLEQLDKYGEHAFTVGVIDPVRGYTRKRLQYIYYDKGNRMILLSRTDITDIYEEEKQLKLARLEAQTDSLTGLYNHKASLHRIQEQLAAHPEEPAAILFIDLDNFKRVNDRLGHQRGDELLIALATRFREVMHPAEILGRVGGDEFIIFLAGMSGREEIRRYAERLRTNFFMLLDEALRSCGVTCSIGIARYPEDAQACADLIRKADIALYTAKRHKGKNEIVFSEQTLKGYAGSK